MAKIVIDLDDGPIKAVLDKLRAATKDLTPLMHEFKALALAAIHRRFDKEGPGWPEHAPSTKARRGPNAPLLRDKRLLEGSTTGGRGGYVEVGKNFVEVGSNVKYARIQNEGGTIVVKARKSKNPDYRPRKGAKSSWEVKIPARRFLPNAEELYPDLLAAAEDYLEEIIGDQ